MEQSKVTLLKYIFIKLEGISALQNQSILDNQGSYSVVSHPEHFFLQIKMCCSDWDANL